MSNAAQLVDCSMPVPYRVDVADSQIAILRFLREAATQGKAALAFLVDIRGGAARSLGSMVAVNNLGGYCGYLSGGCVEAAVAAEALQAMDSGRDRLVRYGEGSDYFDIILPCGGGLTIAIHVIDDAPAIDEALELLAMRQECSLIYQPEREALIFSANPSATGWQESGDFHQSLKPELRLAICGNGLEAKALSRVAIVAGYGVETLETLERFDASTAVIFLLHDIDAELEMMVKALKSNACYIGALGSRRTHQKRVERLLECGLTPVEIDRIHAPIGLFGPTRHSSALALSILAEIASLEGKQWS